MPELRFPAPHRLAGAMPHTAHSSMPHSRCATLRRISGMGRHGVSSARFCTSLKIAWSRIRDVGAGWPHISAWRRQQRAALIARRTALARGAAPGVERGHQRLRAILLPAARGNDHRFLLAVQGEFDARLRSRHFRERGATAALPVVMAKASAAAIPQVVAGRADDAPASTIFRFPTAPRWWCRMPPSCR